MPKIKNVFISHYNKDDPHIQKFKNLMNKNGYQLKNASIDSTKPNKAKNPDYIKKLLRSRIEWSSTCIVLIGHKTHTRDWVNWEIEQAFKKNTRIVGVYLNGVSGAEVPENLDKYGSALIGWNSKSITNAIEGESIWNKPDDTSRPGGQYTTIRVNC